MDKTKLENYLHGHIPMSKAMGIQIQSANLDAVKIKVPLKPNINHKQTVFGGSIHSCATLACWSLLFMHIQLLKEPYHIVIAKSEIDYILPIEDDFEVISLMDINADYRAFQEKLLKKGKARIQLDATSHQSAGLSFYYRGYFVALSVMP